MVMYFRSAATAAGAQQEVRCSNPNLLRTACRSMQAVYCYVFLVNSHLSFT